METLKKIRRIHPLGLRVLVKIKKDDDITESGLYLPEGSKNALAESLLADVIEVATAVDDKTHDETNISGVPLGATVLIGKHAGVVVPWNETLRIVDTKEVLGIVHEMRLD